MKSLLLALTLFTAQAVHANCELLMINVPTYAQKLDYTCGAVCVRSVVEYFTGLKFTEEQVATVLGTYQAGFTHPNAIIWGLALVGLHSRLEVNQSFEDLRHYMRQGEALILSVNMQGSGHYAILRAINGTHVVTMDPWIAREGGRNPVHTLEEFEKLWTVTFQGMVHRGSVLRVSRRPLIL